MGIVNDALPQDVFGCLKQEPCREARLKLAYPRQVNVAGELLDRNLSDGHGSRTAIRFHGQSSTYCFLAERVNKLANALAANGVGPGHRVLLHLRNSPQFIESWLAALRLGAVVVATMPALKRRELQPILAETEPACVIASPELLSALGGHDFLPRMRIAVGDGYAGALAYEDLLQMGGRSRAPALTSEDDVALIAYTSGSTGRPKGTVHTHSDVLAIADTYARHVLAPTPEDCFAGHSPMGFTYGLGALLVFPLRFGASVILDPGPFDPGRYLKLFRDEGVTLLFSTPTACRLYLEEPASREAATWGGVRTVVAAGEPLTGGTFDRWREVTGTEILDGCGSTEMLHIWISQRPGEALGGCTGQPVPLYEARLVNDKGETLSDQEAEGEVALRGPTGCRYWRQPELQAKVIRAGWTLSGDRFRRDSRGRYWYVARTDDMIVTGAYKVSPVEVQEILLRNPAVRDAAVVGVPDELRGQVVRAYIVANNGFPADDVLARELREFAKSQMAAFKCPREIVFLAELPRKSTGKVDRTSLKQRMKP